MTALKSTIDSVLRSGKTGEWKVLGADKIPKGTSEDDKERDSLSCAGFQVVAHMSRSSTFGIRSSPKKSEKRKSVAYSQP